jgi:hypothetical protein
MTSGLSSHDTALWRRLVASHKAWALASKEFLTGDVDRVALLRHRLRTSDKATAIVLAQHLRASELMELFSDLVPLARNHALAQTVRELIGSMPRDWVPERIEGVIEPLLTDATDDEYRRFLELFEVLDHELTLWFAHRAAAHADRDIREAGEEYLAAPAGS